MNYRLGGTCGRSIPSRAQRQILRPKSQQRAHFLAFGPDCKMDATDYVVLEISLSWLAFWHGQSDQVCSKCSEARRL